MKLYGLIGYPLSHSFSASYFKDKFKREGITATDYQLFPITTIEEIQKLLIDHPLLKGLSVTIPYKEKIIPFIDEMDESATKAGAVNTVKIIRNNNSVYLKAYNTDVVGFEKSLTPLLEPFHQQALILGDGGASKAVIYVLEKLNIQYKTVSRKNEACFLQYQQLNSEIIKSHLLIINTTPLGMYPDINNCPQIPYHSLTSSHLLFDLIYNPEETLFLKQGRLHAAKTKNGLEMLKIQAEAAWEIWNQKI